MNERIKELRKQVDVDMHLHNLEDFRAMSGCFGFEDGNKIVDDYLDKFAELIVKECCEVLQNEDIRYGGYGYNQGFLHKKIKEHFGVKE